MRQRELMANMPGFTYPFPTKDLAYQELTYDYCYNKIKEEDKERIVDEAWKKGEETAKEVFAKFNGSYDFRKICVESGLQLNDKDTDYVVGNQRYFSDYVSGTNQINLYLKSIEKWAEENQLSMDDAINLILSHEYFHFMEMNVIGQLSKSYEVPMLVIGKFKLGKTGIHALSEIGAHGFAHQYYLLATQQIL